MAGKRERKRKMLRLPGLAALLGVLMVVLSPAGPAGVAVDSPVMPPAPAPQAQVLPVGLPEALPTPEAPEEEAPAEEPWAPVAESAAVEDTYFSDIVFLGDSRTEGFALYSGLKEGTYLHAVGATVESVFSKNAWKSEGGKKIPLLDALAETDCGKVYVMLGVNELGWSKVETFRDQYGKVIDRIREDHPDAVVVLQSILPVSAKQEAKKSYVNNSRILAYNAAIAELARERDCPYVNVAEAVLGEDGCLRSELTFDGVHLNPAGCRIWLDYLRTHTV